MITQDTKNAMLTLERTHQFFHADECIFIIVKGENLKPKPLAQMVSANTFFQFLKKLLT
jgi:hypothetical protein